MNRNFMIGFVYDGYFYCANVHKLSARQEYHVTILASRPRNGMPSSIVLSETDKGPVPLSSDPISPALLGTIFHEIERHTRH